MRSPNADFHLVPMDGVTVDPYVRTKAANNLKRLYEEGDLKPIPGWEGGVVDGYMDLLGLNDRPIRVNRTVGMKRP